MPAFFAASQENGGRIPLYPGADPCDMGGTPCLEV
jgi:hypothetical protein